jgi:biotin synthase
MLSPEQAKRLKEAGLSAYNHNLDTSREFYPEVSKVSLSIPGFELILTGDLHEVLR